MKRLLAIVYLLIGAAATGVVVYFFVFKEDVDEHPDFTGKYTRPTTNRVPK